MSVRGRMSRRVTTVRPETRLSEAARLMRARTIRHLPVVDRAGRLVGMVTARDLRQALFAPAVQVETEDVLGLLETPGRRGRHDAERAQRSSGDVDP